MHGLTAVREGHEDPKRTKFIWLNQELRELRTFGFFDHAEGEPGPRPVRQALASFLPVSASRPSGSGSADSAKYDLRNGFRVI
jgi:hypothetical protein